jgi:hypothetical protein
MDPTPTNANMPGGELWYCPEQATPPREWAMWYGYNAIGTSRWDAAVPPEAHFAFPYRISDFAHPERMVMIVDSVNHVADHYHSWKVDFAMTGAQTSADPRHRELCSILWLDTHVEALPLLDFLYTPELWRNVD